MCRSGLPVPRSGPARSRRPDERPARTGRAARPALPRDSPPNSGPCPDGFPDHRSTRCGGDQARLALHHHGEAGKILGAGRQFTSTAQLARIDIRVERWRRIRRQALADRDSAQAQISAAITIAVRWRHNKFASSSTLKSARPRGGALLPSGLAGFIVGHRRAWVPASIRTAIRIG